MFCSNCGKAIAPETRFCPHCGEGQTLEPQPPPVYAPAPPPMHASAPPATAAMAMPMSGSPIPARPGKPAVWAAGAAVLVALLGGVGYWGYGNKMAGDEAVSKLAADALARKAADEETARRLSSEEQRRLAAEKVAQVAENTAAQALLDKHIAAEEAQAQATVQGQPKR